MNILDLGRRLPVTVLDDPKTASSIEESSRYSLKIDFEQTPEDPEYVDKYKDGSTRKMRGYWEVHFITDYQMDDVGGQGLLGFTEVHSNRFKLYGRGSLERDPNKAEPVADHELEHQLDPYASESEVRARTNTTSSNPHFSYRFLWSY